MAGKGNEQTSVEAALRDSLTWRCIGPHRGGRVVAVAGDPADAMTFYFGAVAGGVWKTNDGGTYWENISDGFFTTASVGAIAVSESDPNVLYAGTGEPTIRGNVSHGDGVYKSTDAGATWTNVGLAETRHIAKIRIHPANADLVYVAALGHAFGPNKERGVFRSKDGGATWEQVLFRDAETGAIDLAMDPHNPRILYAALWNGRRNFWSLNSGGPSCGLMKSTDGGDSWTELTRNPGLPKGTVGKIGVTVSPAQADRVWAIVEAEDGAVFRSDDGGATWQRMSEQGELRWRSWYYSHIFAHPTQPNTVYVLNGAAWKSTDGGATFVKYPVPHGDNHDLWIDPKNPKRMIQGDDGGAYVTFNDMASWSTLFNQPTAQFYHVITDNQVPYRIYGSQQDNTAMSVPSFSPLGAITQQEWYEPGGGESGYMAVNPKNPEIVFGGAIGSGAGNGRLTRHDRRTGQKRNVTVWPDTPSMGDGAKELKYRFQWTFPLFYSIHEPETLYATSNVVHRSTDEGQSWSVVSPDLTRNDVSKMEPSGGPITKDNTGAEVYGTIFAYVESPHEQGVFWAGSDDGIVHITRDGGTTWENVTPKDLPEWSLISVIEASPHDAGTAYVAATHYKLDDYAPYLFKTSDYGQSWTKITKGIRENDFTRVVREDPARRGLLYAGTETGVYVSFNDGGQWQPFQGTLPVCPIHDLIVQGSDLIAATHGRSFWILDDLTAVRQYTDDLRDAATHLFTPRDFVRLRVYKGYGSDPGPAMSYRMAGTTVITFKQKKKANGETEEVLVNAGENPPDGVIVRYFLKEKPSEPITLTFLDEHGKEVRTITSKKEEAAKPADGEKKKDEEKGPFAPAEAGLNRFVWDTRYAEAKKVPGDTSTEDALAGPMVVPGTYQVRLTVGEQTQTASYRIAKDPRVDVSQRDLEAQQDFLLQLRDKLTETHEAILMLRDVRAQAEGWEKRLGGKQAAGSGQQAADSALSTQHAALVAAAKALREKAKAIEDALIQEKADSPLQPPSRLNAKLATLAGFANSADVAPTQQAQDVYKDLAARIDRQLRQLDDLMEADLGAFNRQIREAGIAAITPQP
ncbi:MAG: WD40/YVTN/BNR-like repeat-containing protein [Thermomicrobiales bacterium]